MDKEDSKTLQHISNTLDEVLAIMKRPENKFERGINIAAAIMGVLGILGIIDLIRNWIGG